MCFKLFINLPTFLFSVHKIHYFTTDQAVSCVLFSLINITQAFRYKCALQFLSALSQLIYKLQKQTPQSWLSCTKNSLVCPLYKISPIWLNGSCSLSKSRWSSPNVLQITKKLFADAKKIKFPRQICCFLCECLLRAAFSQREDSEFS